jgi:hypothetical protein
MEIPFQTLAPIPHSTSEMKMLFITRLYNAQLFHTVILSFFLRSHNTLQVGGKFQCVFNTRRRFKEVQNIIKSQRISFLLHFNWVQM